MSGFVAVVPGMVTAGATASWMPIPFSVSRVRIVVSLFRTAAWASPVAAAELFARNDAISYQSGPLTASTAVASRALGALVLRRSG